MARFRSELAILLSFVLTLGVILNAFYHKKQFYPSIVYLTKSNSSMAVLYLQAFVVALLVGKVMNKIFFGQLRAIEMEHLFERSWYAITETCLAFTVFRDDFSPEFVTMFTLLLFLKCFHWLAEDRVEFMERSPVITLLFHVRIIGLIALLMVLDLNFVHIAYGHTLVKGASVQLVFGFEYAILFFNVLSTFIKYLLHTIDLQSENPWENKGIYMLYSDLVLGLIRVALYLIFMSLMIKIHTFPLFAIRPMYLSLRSFKKSFSDVIMSRRAIRNLNIMYPDVTAEQLRNYTDTICIICREEMSNGDANDNNNNNNGNAGNNNGNMQQIKKLPCDHIFHKNCLRSWFQRQQTCPTCRTPILRINPAHVHAQPQAAQAQQGQQQQQQQPGQAPAAGGATPAGAAAQNPNQMPGVNLPGGANNVQNPIINPFAANLNNLNAPLPNQSPFARVAPIPPFAADFAAGAAMFAPPPFGMMGANFPLPPFASLPPPLPPLNLSPTLTPAELAEMEGNERHNVEARIHCLRNLSVLLNASMVHMQQYMNICAATSHLENVTQTRSKVKIEDDLNLLKSDSKLTPDFVVPAKTSAANAAQGEEGVAAATAEETSASTSTNGDNNNIPSEESATQPKEPVDPEADALRRRRLQHYQTASGSS